MSAYYSGAGAPGTGGRGQQWQAEFDRVRATPVHPLRPGVVARRHPPIHQWRLRSVLRCSSGRLDLRQTRLGGGGLVLGTERDGSRWSGPRALPGKDLDSSVDGCLLQTTGATGDEACGLLVVGQKC